MTINERIDRLNALQLKHYTKPLNDEERAEWRSITFSISSEGYKIRKHHRVMKIINGQMVNCVVWSANIPKRNRQCEFIYTNMRPNHTTLKGDCTTRALSFVLQGEMTYDEIEARQYDIAKMVNDSDGRVGKSRYHRNSTVIWPRILTERGYSWINLSRYSKKSQANIASFIKGCIKKPVLALSASHVSIIDTMGCVRDTWDSRGVRITNILVKDCDIPAIVEALDNNNICVKSVTTKVEIYR